MYLLKKKKMTSNDIRACLIDSYASMLQTQLCLAHQVELHTKRTLSSYYRNCESFMCEFIYVVNSVRSASAINALFRSHSEAVCVYHKFMHWAQRMAKVALYKHCNCYCLIFLWHARICVTLLVYSSISSCAKI